MAEPKGTRPPLLLGVALGAIRYLKLASSGSGWEPVLDGLDFTGGGRVITWTHPDGRPHRALASELVAVSLTHPDNPDAR
jgi:hypothetical protein